MRNWIVKAAGSLALGATVLGVAATPAEAQRGRYRGYHHHRGGDHAGTAIAAGIVGLGIGAAIASSNNRRYYDDGPYYDGPYYDGPYYDGPYYREYRPYRVYPRYRGYYRYDRPHFRGYRRGW